MVYNSYSKVNWNAETSLPLSLDFEALKTVWKEFLKNSFSFSRYRLLKSKNSVGHSRFRSFSEKCCRAISVCDVIDDLYSQYKAEFHREDTDFLSSEPGSQKVYFEDFYRIFLKCVVVCPLELQGINNMWIFALFEVLILMDHGYGRTMNVTMIMSSSFVTRLMDNSNF